MKTSTFTNRTNGINKSSNGYQNARALLTAGGRMYTCQTSGHGRFCKNLDYTQDTIKVLKLASLKQGIDFSLENDSPRGGLTGNYLVLTSKGKRKMIK